MYNVMWLNVWLPEVKFDACNNLLSSVHTASSILSSVSLRIKQKCYVTLLHLAAG